MSYLKNTDTNTLITHFVSLEEKQEVIRTEQTLLSGGVYLQRHSHQRVHRHRRLVCRLG